MHIRRRKASGPISDTRDLDNIDVHLVIQARFVLNVNGRQDLQGRVNALSLLHQTGSGDRALRGDFADLVLFLGMTLKEQSV